MKTCFIVRDSTGQAARLNFANLIIDAAQVSVPASWELR